MNMLRKAAALTIVSMLVVICVQPAVPFQYLAPPAGFASGRSVLADKFDIFDEKQAGVPGLNQLLRDFENEETYKRLVVLGSLIEPMTNPCCIKNHAHLVRFLLSALLNSNKQVRELAIQCIEEVTNHFNENKLNFQSMKTTFLPFQPDTALVILEFVKKDYLSPLIVDENRKSIIELFLALNPWLFEVDENIEIEEKIYEIFEDEPSNSFSPKNFAAAQFYTHLD